MRSVLISIQPKWVQKILYGEKTYEARKSFPRAETPFKCYIYCTMKSTKDPKEILEIHSEDKIYRANGKVVGEFICDDFYFGSSFDGIYDVPEEVIEGSCLSSKDILSYAYNERKDEYSNLYFWHISDLKVYDKPKEIYDFRKPGALELEDIEEGLCAYCDKTLYGEYKSYRTPNGLVMCEGAYCEEAYEEYLEQNSALNWPPQSWMYVEELKGE